ncbi:MAG: GlsB/YeaQ/YmgE family stress response membrane protein [Crocinitomicaceae bacterium]|nr:GlsB/YeaQ/YmgE family stress response membrane protein [Crocinitomicaceae bacterium]
MDVLFAVLIGAIAGWLAGIIMKSKSGGVLMNIILGVVGGFVGNWLFGVLGFAKNGSFLGSIITATIGAIVLIAIGKYLGAKKK